MKFKIILRSFIEAITSSTIILLFGYYSVPRVIQKSITNIEMGDSIIQAGFKANNSFFLLRTLALFLILIMFKLLWELLKEKEVKRKDN